MKEPPKGTSATLLMLVATACSLVYFLIVHRDFTLLTYPFKFPDSWVWLVEALSYLGYDVGSAVLAPVTPLSFASLLNMGWDVAIPYRGIVFHHLMIPGLFLLVRSGTGSSRIALVASVLCLTSSSLLGNSLYIGSDVAANAMLLFAMLFFWLGVNRNRNYLWPMALCWGISALTQYAGFFLAFPFVGYLVFCDRRLLRDPRIWAGFVLAGLLASSQFLYRYLEFGNLFYSRAKHLSLVRFHLDSIGQYAWWWVGFFSIPVLAMAAVGVWEVICRERYRKLGMLLVLWIATMTVFFVFAYTWEDSRFVQYVAPQTLALAAIGLRRLIADLRSGAAAKSSGLALPSTTHQTEITRFDLGLRDIPTQGRRAIAHCLAVAILLAGAASKTQPFANEIVLMPGLAVKMRSVASADPARLQVQFEPDWSWKRYHFFYYSHATGLHRFRSRGTPIPCTFNQATDPLVRLLPQMQARLSEKGVIGLASDAQYNWHVERHTLSFLARRRVIAWEGLDDLDADGASRLEMVVTASDMRRSSRELVPRASKPSVLTIKSGRRVRQRMILPEGTVDLELLTGTFDREGVVVHYALDRESPDHSACGQGDATIGNNVYTPLLPKQTKPLPAGSYVLALENRTLLDVAIYTNEAHQSDGWELVGTDGTPLAGGLTMRAITEDERWSQAFDFVARSGKFWLWNRREDRIGLSQTKESERSAP